MKTKDVIAKLQELDPTGETECCIGNADILAIYTQPAYWDGCLQTFDREGHKIKGAKIISEGNKIVIHDLSIREALMDQPNLPVEFTTKYTKDKYEKSVERWREETDEIKTDVARGFFVKYVQDKTKHLKVDDDQVKKEAKNFFDANLSHDDPLDMKGGESINDARIREWDKRVIIEEHRDASCSYEALWEPTEIKLKLKN